MARHYRYNPRKVNRRRKRKYFRNRGSKSQASQLAKLDKKVTGISRTLSLDRAWFNYWESDTEIMPNYTSLLGGYGYNCVPVLNPVRMRPCFDTPNQTDVAKDQWVYHGSNMHVNVNINNESDSPIKLTFFLVSLRKEARATAILNWGNSLQNFFAPGIIGTDEPDEANPNPIMCFNTGQSMINKKIFKVHRIHHKTIGQVGYGTTEPPVRNISDTVVDLKYKIKKRVTLARSQQGIIEALETGMGALNRNAQTYLIVVSNNSSLDIGSPILEYTTVHTFSAHT